MNRLNKAKIIFSTCDLDNENYFVGFHDICPWNNCGNVLAVHSFSTSDELEKSRNRDDNIEIRLWNLEENLSLKVDRTSTWNWQQGSRLQWMKRDKDNCIIYNNRDNKNKPISVIYDTKNKEFKYLSFPVYSLSSTQHIATSMNYARLGKYWKGYGYVDLFSEFDIDDPCPVDDGLFLIDLKKNQRTLLISLKEIVSFKSPLSPSDNIERFIAHPTFSPSGKRICFFDRFHSLEGALLSRFFVIDTDGSNLKLLGEGKWSHFDWVSDDELIIWSRASDSIVNKMNKSNSFSKNPILRSILRLGRKLAPSLKSKVTKEFFRKINVINNKSTVFAKGIITEDGHPMLSNHGDWMVNDTYPNKEKVQTLMLYNFKNNRRYDLDKFSVPDKFLDSDLKCDLHPRWNHNCDKICIDSAHSEKRQVYIIDVSNLDFYKNN